MQVQSMIGTLRSMAMAANLAAVLNTKIAGVSLGPPWFWVFSGYWVPHELVPW